MPEVNHEFPETEIELEATTTAQKSNPNLYDNPFAGEHSGHSSSTHVNAAKEWPTTEDSTIAEGENASPAADESQSWEKRAAEIESRTRELQRREEELRRRESLQQPHTLHYPGTTGNRPKNWPFFYPLVHHAIDEEIPENVTCLAYTLNLVTEVLMLVSGVKGFSGIAGIIFAGLYAVIFPILAFFSWHTALYRALRFDSSPMFVTYFALFGVQLVFYGFLTLGLFSGGAGGIFGMLDMFANGAIVAGVAGALCSACMICCLALGLLLMKGVLSHFRGSGHTVESAGQSMGRSVATNQTVRRMAKETVLNNV